MKTFFISAILLFVIAVNAKAQAPDTTLVIQFASLVHDYGTINQGSDGGCEFKFENKGKTPLVLSNVRASCGCTVPTWPREPILPGKTGVIKVMYNTNSIGNFNKSITVSSNAKNTDVLLTIKGNVVASASLTVSSESVSLSYGLGATNTFSINSTVSWNITDDVDWLDIKPVSGANNGTVTITSNSENKGTTARKATVTITGKGVSNKTILVTQDYSR